VRQVLAIDFAPDGYHVATGALGLQQDLIAYCCGVSCGWLSQMSMGPCKPAMLSLCAGCSKVMPVPALSAKQSAPRQPGFTDS
jgi:hypothetical protein